MGPIKPEYLAREQKYWMRHDAHKFIRPDWRRHVKPGSELAAIYETYERKFRVDQLRDWRGRFADEGGGIGGSSSERSLTKVAGRISRQRAEQCDIMHKQDLFICNAFQSAACYGQAYVRYALCQKGLPVPPLNF